MLYLRPAAEADIDAAADHYFRESGIDLAAGFYRAVEQTWDTLLAHPHLGATYGSESPQLEGCRHWPVTRPFEIYRVFYLPSQRGIEIVRVLHGARDLPELLK